MPTDSRDVDQTLGELATRWGVVIETTRETHTGIIAYGLRGTTAVVLKAVKRPGDEWYSGEVVEAFDGGGVVRVCEHTGGALLLERLDPGQSLVELSRGGRDAAATDVVASVIGRMAPGAAPERCATVADWGEGFSRYLATNDARVPRPLVVRARQTFRELCQSQGVPRLLHGDLQHSNILYDRERGWLAVDPKGVIGELEYELGAVLRNPRGDPGLFTAPDVVARRVQQLTAALQLDRARVLRWAFAQAVLSAIWDWEDGAPDGNSAPLLVLAGTIQEMIHAS